MVQVHFLAGFSRQMQCTDTMSVGSGTLVPSQPAAVKNLLPPCPDYSSLLLLLKAFALERVRPCRNTVSKGDGGVEVCKVEIWRLSSLITTQP